MVFVPIVRPLNQHLNKDPLYCCPFVDAVDVVVDDAMMEEHYGWQLLRRHPLQKRSFPLMNYCCNYYLL